MRMPMRHRHSSRWFVRLYAANATAELVGKSMNAVELTYISKGCGCNIAITQLTSDRAGPSASCRYAPSAANATTK